VRSERYLRPEAAVLGDGSLVPPENEIRPPPDRFTHELARDTPFYFRGKAGVDHPDGRFEAATKVLLLRKDAGARCRVADGRGLYVEIDCASLAKLEDPEDRDG